MTGDLLNALTDFLKERKLDVALNSKHSKWSNIYIGVLQGSILGPFVLLIYINDLSDNISSNSKLLTDDIWYFSVVHDINQSVVNLNDGLERKSNRKIENEFQPWN